MKKFDRAVIKNILVEYYMGVGRTLFIKSKSRNLFKMKSAYGDSWDEKLAEEVYAEIEKEIEEGKL
jgi:hypothetical protein